MKRNIKLTSLLVMTLLGAGAGSIMADDDSDDYRPGMFKRWFGGGEPGVTAVADPVYQEECGSCHFAYPPGLLPAASWETIMAGLDDHFGDNAELPPQQAVQIRNFLLDNAAGRNASGVSRNTMNALGDRTQPLRITETAYFLNEHDEIPRAMVKDNPQVRSFSNCDACHTRAAQGSFNEHEVRIPGYRRWED